MIFPLDRTGLFMCNVTWPHNHSSIFAPHNLRDQYLALSPLKDRVLGKTLDAVAKVKRGANNNWTILFG
jgi:hypothetical protein